MNFSIFFILGFFLFGAMIVLIWRFSSKRIHLPCPSWLGWLIERDNPFTKTNRANEIIAQLNLKSGMKILDAGCGPGRLTIPAAKKVGPSGEVTALDIQEEMLTKVKKKATDEKLENIRLLKAVLGENQLTPNQFDCALLVTVLGEIPNQQAALKEIYTSLKPGGILSITEVIFDPHFQRMKKVGELCESTGFHLKIFVGKPWAYNFLVEKPVSYT
ncbi:MAG: methyltransferase domain-containing protein [Chlamydiales bacterium]|nr:methyltransferase domain-containing protein [Chlamydiales bacterium]